MMCPANEPLGAHLGGAINFHNAQADIERILAIVQTLNVSPTHFLQRDLAQNISTRQDACSIVFEKISKFSLDLQNLKESADLNR